MIDNEEWRDIPGYEGYYQASSLGRIRSLDREITQVNRWGSTTTYLKQGCVLATGPYSGERYRVRLSCDGVKEQKGVAVLVALAFHGVPESGKDWALHRDGDMFNNVPDNLYWGDRVDNVQDAIRHGTHHGKFTKVCRHGHSLSGSNLKINTTLGSRYCLACRKATAWSKYWRNERGVMRTDAEKRAYADEKYAEIMSIA